jgi:hypothetical protein
MRCYLLFIVFLLFTPVISEHDSVGDVKPGLIEGYERVVDNLWLHAEG